MYSQLVCSGLIELVPPHLDKKINICFQTTVTKMKINFKKSQSGFGQKQDTTKQLVSFPHKGVNVEHIACSAVVAGMQALTLVDIR